MKNANGDRKDAVDHPEPAESLHLGDEARFQRLNEANADGIVVVGLDGTIAYANPAAIRLLDGRLDHRLGPASGLVLADGGSIELDVVCQSGEPRVAELKIVLAEWECRPAFLISVRDITERKRLEGELRQQVEQLMEADRLKDQFLAMLAHELRNPLAPILNAAYAMRGHQDDSTMLIKMRDVVEHEASHIAYIVDDLLDVSRFSRGKIQLRKEVINLATAIDQAIEGTRSLLEARRHALTVTLPDDPIWVEADPARMRQVLTNLLDNAIKYTDPGGTIQISAVRDGDDAVIRVQDNGIGIEPEMLPRIFDLFAQADRSIGRSRGRAGNRSDAVADTRDSPWRPDPRRERRSGKRLRDCGAPQGWHRSYPPHSAPTVPTAMRAQTRSRTVLIVDDNKFAADSLASVLELAGHQPRVAYNGHDALGLIDSFVPEVVLLDIGLPGMDGFEVAREMRRHKRLKGVLLMAVTGYGHDEVLQRSAEAGFDHHLVKPLDLDALLTMLKEAPHAANPG